MLKEHWREYTVRDINKIKRSKCIKCKYAKKCGTPGNAGLNSGNKNNIGNIYCDYLSMTGHIRGCRPDECDKYEPLKKGEKHHVKF